ncbi:ABC transporter permease [Nocardioides nitrophenolicus]|uniref:ABC transporter permease n=1 Tax=Nocardioides nitrophenolicus TaxID=60489 RepID=UPI0019570223|nr:ABC transporter permease [Nocardioides nitrophenolicus]MBM7519892.1 ribose transport system permease protein/putative xylitol transport system permease protein [Nocardioides nitrophenolicus]
MSQNQAQLAPAPAAVTEDRRLLRRLDRHRNVLVPTVAVVALVVYFQSQTSAFVSADSAQNILRQMAFLTVVALAGTFVILIGGIDLSVAANATLAGILIATWIDDFGGTLAILLVVAVGAVVGLVNGLITTFLKVPSFLVTLGMMSILNGISNSISNGGPVSYRSDLLQRLVNESTIPGIPNGALIAIVLTAIATVIAFATPFGRHLYAVGSNERAAALSGVRVQAVKLAVFALAGAVAAIAGIIFTGQASTGVPMGADPSLLNSIAAIVVGGTALSGGVGGPHRTLLGALVIVLLSSGMDITSVDPYTQLIVKGAVVIAAVALTIDRRRYGIIK